MYKQTTMFMLLLGLLLASTGPTEVETSSTEATTTPTNPPNNSPDPTTTTEQPIDPQAPAATTKSPSAAVTPSATETSTGGSRVAHLSWALLMLFPVAYMMMMMTI